MDTREIDVRMVVCEYVEANRGRMRLADLAKAAGMTTGMLSYFLSGKRMLGDRLLRQLCVVIGLHPGEMLMFKYIKDKSVDDEIKEYLKIGWQTVQREKGTA